MFFVYWPLPLGLAERSACRVDQISGAYGWWGERTRFLTSLPFCRTENYVPGLHLLTFQHPRNDSQPDKVRSPNFNCNYTGYGCYYYLPLLILIPPSFLQPCFDTLTPLQILNLYKIMDSFILLFFSSLTSTLTSNFVVSFSLFCNALIAASLSSS